VDHHGRGAGSFKLLTNDGEREKFVESFWIRRDPRRTRSRMNFAISTTSVSVCQRAFQCRHPGIDDRPRPDLYHLWATDEIESHPSGGTYDYRPAKAGLNANVPSNSGATAILRMSARISLLSSWTRACAATIT